jgi:winged helix-turn helix protein
MKGCKPATYHLRAGDRRYLQAIVRDGSQLQRVARRAHILLALDRGERIVEIMRGLNVSRMGIWHLRQRYQQRGVEAIFDEKRSGRPVVFSPAGARANRADGVYRPRSVRSTLHPLGLSEPTAVRGRARCGGHDPLHDGGADSRRGQSAPAS